MKRIFALILIIAMLVPLAVACNSDDETTTTTEIIDNDKFTSKDTVKKDWEGKTVLVAATSWSKNPSYPWSTMELVIKEGETSEWGEKIDKAVLERTAYIKATYGVDVVWEWASRFNTHDVLKNAILAGNDPDYDLAMPRTFRAQTIVADGSVYDMANRPYINFNNSYYNQDSVKTYTAKGHTFFVASDFSHFEKETALVIYFNKALLGGDEEANKLYQLVRDGKWTWDKLVTYAESIHKDDGDGRWGDSDTYGLSTYSQFDFYLYFGLKQAGTDDSTGDWEISLNEPPIYDIVNAMVEVNTSTWGRTAWGGIWPDHPSKFFVNGTILFHNDTIENLSKFAKSDNMGIVPFPKLNEEQDKYCVATQMEQIILMCVPKTTSDRSMSDYFVDVLSWTGKEYTTKAYCEKIYELIKSDIDKEMLDEYIFPNITYDAGAAVGWTSLLGSVIGQSSNYNQNQFDKAFAEHEADALKTIKQWNEAWGSYTE